MGTFRKSHEEKEPSFSGGANDWEEFRTDVNNYLEDKEIQWIICGAQAIAKYFQSIVTARTADKSLQGTPMQTDLAMFSDKQMKKSNCCHGQDGRESRPRSGLGQEQEGRHRFFLG